MKFFVRVPEGAMYPRGYGRIYYEWERPTGVGCPVPFNWILRYAREFYLRLQFPRPNDIDQFDYGYDCGFNDALSTISRVPEMKAFISKYYRLRETR